MKKIPNEIFKYISSIETVKYYNNYVVINNKYIVLKRYLNVDIIKYLEKIGFNDFFYDELYEKDDYSIFSLSNNNENNIVNILSNLYSKSSNKKSFDGEFARKIYEKLSYNIDECLKYYYKMQDNIEELLFPNITYYKMLINISSIYHLLYLGKYFLDKWFNSNNYSYHEVLITNCLEKDNFYDNKIINIDMLKNDCCIFEIANYYKLYFENKSIWMDIDYLCDDYLFDDECYLLFSLISIPDKVIINSVDDVNKIVEYTQKTYEVLLQKYKENQEDENTMLNTQ